MLNTEIACPNCGVSTKAFEKKGIRYVCEVCRGWTVNLGKKIEDLEKNYGQEYFKGLNPSQNSDYVNYDLALGSRLLNHKKKLKWISKLSDVTSLKVLELGSATGDFLRILKDLNIPSIGIEISEHARLSATEQGVESFSPDRIENECKKRSHQPNCLIAWDVWEHLENPAEYFKDLMRAFPSIETIILTTVDGGSIVAKMRQESWRQFHPPTHINYPTKKSYELWADQNGLEIKQYSYIGYSRPLFEYLKVFGIKTTLGKHINLTVDMLDIPFIVLQKRIKA